MKKLSFLLIATIATSVMSQTIPPAIGPNTGDLKFNGAINELCNLQNFVDGTVVTNINQTVMSSKLSGGTAASVNVRTNSNGYSLILGNPILIGPNGEERNISVVLDAVGNGTDLVGTVKGAFTANNGRMLFDSGLYSIVVNGDVTKSTGAFQAGSYILRVPISCVKAGSSNPRSNLD